MSDNKKNIIWLGVTTAVFVAVIVLLITPLMQNISSLTKDHYDKRVKLAILQKQSSNITTMKRDYSKIQDDINAISQVFIPKKETLKFISTLENMAAQNNVTQKIQLEGIRISDLEQETREVKQMPIGLSLSGDFNNIVKYLNQIESLSYYINFNKLTFTGSGLSVSLTVTGITYWQ